MQFVFNGRIEYEGAIFLVEADTEDEAREKLQGSDWSDVTEDISGASMVNFMVGRLSSAD